MEVRGIIKSMWIIIAAIACIAADPRGPFPIGRQMMSQGAIVEGEGVSGRQPWNPAAY